MNPRSRARRILAVALALAAPACGPAAGGAGGGGGPLRVMASTEIIADLARRVGGERVVVDTVVPPGGDPHSYEPTPADAAKVARADVGFTNHLLLEDHALVKLLDANLPAGAANVALAENAEPHGATLIPLVEDVGLDVLWLGLGVQGQGPARTADVRLQATALEGPGNFALYVTDVLGQPEVFVHSADGLDHRDVVVLPPNAHTHLNWAFSAPGTYRLGLSATLVDDGRPPVALGEATFTFAVAVDPGGVAPGSTVLGDGHSDVTVDLATGELFVRSDPGGDLPASMVVLEVPARALALVPEGDRFAFLGPPGAEVWELPQAVLGKHVHGEIDPHLWLDVRNARAYAQVIAETLVGADPGGRADYEANLSDLVAELDELHGYVQAQIDRIPPDRRALVTTHDAFGYLARAYGMEVAGFVVPNPAQQPSAEQLVRLTRTIQSLEVPAVFIEPNLATRAGVLARVARDQGVAVCRIYGDSFDGHVGDYVAMMRHNADELRRCLAGPR